MTDKPTPTDAELKAMWQIHAADIGGIFYYARAVLAKWGTLRADKIVIPTDTMEQEFQQHYRRGYEAGKKASTPQPTRVQPIAQAAEPVAWRVHPFDYGIGHEGVYAMTMREEQREAWRRKGWNTEPLFAAPQPVAREQLTPERVKEIVRGAGYDQCGIPDTERAAFINGLRHGEQAHGIRGGQHGTE